MKECEMSEQAQQALVDRWLGAFNGQDAAALVSMFTEDGYLEDLPLKHIAKKKGDLRDFLVFNFKAFPNWRLTIDNWDATDRTIVIEFTMRCERMGPIPGLHAEGKPATIRAVSVLTIENGRIKVERDYWDMAEAMRQTGDLPSPA
jgi:steroid delta-isomerase-like uncharacterized protein